MFDENRGRFNHMDVSKPTFSCGITWYETINHFPYNEVYFQENLFERQYTDRITTVGKHRGIGELCGFMCGYLVYSCVILPWFYASIHEVGDTFNTIIIHFLRWLKLIITIIFCIYNGNILIPVLKKTWINIHDRPGTFPDIT